MVLYFSGRAHKEPCGFTRCRTAHSGSGQSNGIPACVVRHLLDARWCHKNPRVRRAMPRWAA
eukprot:6137911-Alexandrium_andersonii.AAC.1